MQDRFTRYFLISLVFHIILFLIFFNFMKGLDFSTPIPAEIELLELSDIQFPQSEKSDAPDNSVMNRERLMKYDDPIFNTEVIGSDEGEFRDEDLSPLERFSIPLAVYQSTYRRGKTQIKPMQLKDPAPPSVEEELSEFEESFKEERQERDKRDYEIISKDLEGRKLLNAGKAPQGLTFSKNEKITLQFSVTPDGMVENIIPETITSGANLDVAINMLRDFRWEKATDGKTVNARIIFNFRVR